MASLLRGMARAPRWGWALLLIAAMPVLLRAQEDSTLESVFDYAWMGTIELKTSEGKREFPMVVNLNARGKTGFGFAVLPDNFDDAPTQLDTYPLQSVKPKGNRIRFKVVADEPLERASASNGLTHSFSLSYRASDGTLRGKLRSKGRTAGRVARGTVVLRIMSSAQPITRVWTGTFKNMPLILTLIGDSADARTDIRANGPRGGGGASRLGGVTGSAFLGDAFAKLEDGELSGTKLTGTLNFPNGSRAGRSASTLTLNLKLKKKGRLLKGKATLDGKKSDTKLTSAGFSGKRLAVRALNPTNLTVGATTEITATGTFDPGVVVHAGLGVPGDGGGGPGGGGGGGGGGDTGYDRLAGGSSAQVTAMEYVSASEIRLSVAADAGLVAGTTVSLSVINADGQQVDLPEALTVASDGGGGGSVSFAGDIQPVFSQSCALSGCHTGASPDEGLDLSAGQAYSNTVNVASRERPELDRIEPGDPDNSYLIRKILGANISGSRMPLNRAPLDAAVIQMFETWVQEGALDN